MILDYTEAWQQKLVSASFDYFETYTLLQKLPLIVRTELKPKKKG